MFSPLVPGTFFSCAAHPAFARAGPGGTCEYPEPVRRFLSSKRERTLSRAEILGLHLRFAQAFAGAGRWPAALHHLLRAERWQEALGQVEAHRRDFLTGVPPAGFWNGSTRCSPMWPTGRAI